MDDEDRRAVLQPRAAHESEAQTSARGRMEASAVQKRKANEMEEDDYDEEEPAKEEVDAQTSNKKPKMEREDKAADQVDAGKKLVDTPMLVPKSTHEANREEGEKQKNETTEGNRTRRKTMTEFEERNKCVIVDCEHQRRRTSGWPSTDIENANRIQERSGIAHRRTNEPLREFS